MAELEAAITPRTRVLVLNTPHNPTGKMLTREELEGVAAVVKRHPDLIVVTDEVYEHITYDGRVHQRIASLPDMCVARGMARRRCLMARTSLRRAGLSARSPSPLRARPSLAPAGRSAGSLGRST